MASTTIIAPAGAKALEQARIAAQRQAELDGYEAFRLLKDAYEEDARPSADDVESVLSVVASALAVAPGQNEWEAVSSFEGRQFVTGRLGRGKPFRTDLQKPIHMAGQGLREGRTWTLRLSPGVMGLRCSDENKKERAAERKKERDRKAAEMAVTRCTGCALLDLRPVAGAVGEIREWSARSRSRLAELVASLDYSDWLKTDGALAMVTLTLPGDWLTVAPDGATFKKLLKRFEMRWRRNVGPWRLLWKLEFQRRGAPHWHALMRVPALVGRQTFEEWLSATWADVVNHPDAAEKEKHLAAGTGVDYSGKDFSDPRRISLYFLGHSAKTTDGKEYQHVVPEEWQLPGKGPGRFWGNPGLESAMREIEISEYEAMQAARVLRKVKRAREWTTAVIRERGKLDVGRRHEHVTFGVEVRAKAGQKRGRAAQRTHRRKLAAAAAAKGQPAETVKRFTPSSLGAGGYAVGGWVLINDALALGLDLARFFDHFTVAPTHVDVLGRGSRAERWATVNECRAARGAAPLPVGLDSV